MAIGTFGMNAVDWEQRIDLDRLRRERLARLQRRSWSAPSSALC